MLGVWALGYYTVPLNDNDDDDDEDGDHVPHRHSRPVPCSTAPSESHLYTCTGLLLTNPSQTEYKITAVKTSFSKRFALTKSKEHAVPKT